VARSVYVAGMTPGAGKSIVALGVAELLSRRVDRLGLFRPLGGDGPDPVVDLLRERYHVDTPPSALFGVTYAEAAHLLAEGRTDDLITNIVDRYRACARPDHTTLIIGSDVDEATRAERHPGIPQQLALHVRLATEFGSVMLPVVDAHAPDDTADAVRTAYHAVSSLGVTVVAVVANRVPPEDRDKLLAAVSGLPVPVYAGRADRGGGGGGAACDGSAGRRGGAGSRRTRLCCWRRACAHRA
jgi:phosphate acetyltransferase